MRRARAAWSCSVALALAACAPDAAPPRRPPPGTGPIFIGEFHTLSGPDRARGNAYHDGFALAIDERNALGGVFERVLVVQTYDDRGVAEDAARAVTRLAQEQHAVFVVGGSTAELARAAAAQTLGVPFVSPAPGAVEHAPHTPSEKSDAQPALLCTSPRGAATDALPATPASDTFRALWRSAHAGAEPTFDAARGYDVGQLVVRAMERTETYDAPDLWAALLALAPWDGASGRVELAR